MKPYHLLLAFLLLGFFIGCQNSAPIATQQNTYNLIPFPEKLEARSGQFQLNDQVHIFSEDNTPDFANVAAFLQKEIKARGGLSVPLSEKATEKDVIRFRKNSAIYNKEGYTLTVNPYDILIEAAEPAGAFYAVQTLLQLYNSTDNKTSFACVHINDQPRFSYRGMHLDVARHFFPPAFVKKYIDLLAMHKYNSFHWHLTEDQGWRIEIKKYPKLQEVAAFRKQTLVGHYNDQPHQFDGKRYGGFYTQEEVKEIVAYAKEGHSLAALAAYPELGCTDEQHEVGTIWGVFDQVYCPKEETFVFLENVLLEVMALFPSEYIHIGGDECPKTAWKQSAFCQQLIKKENLKDEHGLQSYFIRRMEQFLNKNGRQIIGWDEILEGGLAPNATVMSWRGIEGGIAAARQKHKVIMTPGSHCYFDHYQSNSPDEPLAIGGFSPLKNVYSFEPIPAELTAEEAKYIIGAQANVWTEYLPTPELVEYMAYPRALALAEVVWSPASARNYDDFTKRLSEYLPQLDRLKVNYANHFFEVITKINPKPNGEKGMLISLSSLAPESKIYYSLDGKDPNDSSLLYDKPIALDASGTLKAICYRNGKAVSRITRSDFSLHGAAGKNISLTNEPHPSYSSGGKEALVNGIVGSDQRYGDGEWLGWSGADFEATIDLGKAADLKNIRLRFFNGNGQWIYLPKQIVVSTSADGVAFTEVLTKDLQIKSTDKVVPVDLPLTNLKTQHLRVKAVRHGIIGEGEQGAGHEAWLFVDEVVVN
jgi:hexosaminidase